MEELTYAGTIHECLLHRDYCAYHAEQAGYGNELRVHCTDGDVVFADDKLNRRGCVLTYPNDRK